MLLSDTQQGFRKHHSTIANLAWAINTSSPQTRTLLIDFFKAFDSVDIPIVLAKIRIQLRHSTASPPVQQATLAALHSLFCTTFTKIRINQVHSRIIKRDRGIPQGSCLSGDLWNVHVDDLLVQLCHQLPSSLGTTPSSAFADDIAIRSTSDDDIFQAFQLIANWATAN
ncbi:hypothetical protein HDU80_003549, partial [Chytriomyces hyalinus]